MLSINGLQPRDVIEWRVAADESEVALEVRRGGLETLIDVRKRVGEPLGAEVSSAVFDRVRTCDNHCEFCFIYQLPKGLRRSLYLKDDDYRLSFLYGNFTTLTRFTEAGAPGDLAESIASALDVFSLLDITDMAQRVGEPSASVIPLYFAISDRYDIDRTLVRITDLPPGVAGKLLRVELFAWSDGWEKQPIAAADGPIGALGVPLNAGRSIAVDQRFIPLGAPLWLDTEDPDGVKLNRLVVAQDVGAAITGPVRGDLFWGHGEDAFAKAARMKSSGGYFVFVPKPVDGQR